MFIQHSVRTQGLPEKAGWGDKHKRDGVRMKDSISRLGCQKRVKKEKKERSKKYQLLTTFTVKENDVKLKMYILKLLKQEAELGQKNYETDEN